MFAALGLAAVALAGCKTSTGASASTSTGGATAAATSKAPAHSEDVAITACAAQPDTGWVAAKVTVTNNSSKPSNYIITIAFDSADGKTQLDTGLVSVNALAPGQKTEQDAIGTKDAQPGYTCRVSDITRLAA